MAHKVPGRKGREVLHRRFKAALAYEGITAEEFAARQPVTAYHLGEVMKGRRASARIIASVQAFIGEFEQKVVRDMASTDVQKHAA